MEGLSEGTGRAIVEGQDRMVSVLERIATILERLEPPEAAEDEKISANDAAKILGMTAYSLKECIKNGQLNIGTYTGGEGKAHGRFFISKNLVAQEAKRRGIKV